MQKCLRCEGPLEKGFLLDRGDSDLTHQSGWASGEPNTAFFRMSAVKAGNKRMPVTTWRCTQCGHLESFAHPAPEK